MTNYLIRRFLLLIPTLFGITVLTFAMTRLAGNPADLKGHGGESGGKPMTAETKLALEKLYGWDKPTPIAYIDWVGKMARLDFGNSIMDDRPVFEKIKERLPVTVTLNLASVIVVYFLSIPLGIYCALKRGQVVDRLFSFVLFFLYSIPTFVMGIFLITYVSGGDYLNLLPLYGVNSIDAPEMSNLGWLLDYAKHMILPVICLSYVGLASLSRYTRSGFLEVIGQDFIRTARAKGVSERVVVFRHALGNTLIPLITLLTGELPGLIAGSVIIEQIFSLPGMGQLALQSLEGLDLPVIMGLVTITAMLTLISNLIADVTYALVDPRVRYT